MKILLDENITQKSIPILQKYKHDVIHILDRCNAGQSDERVFQLALKEQRVLITLNGKDFIPASNEPSGHACMSIWRLPQGSNTPQLATGYLTAIRLNKVLIML